MKEKNRIKISFSKEGISSDISLNHLGLAVCFLIMTLIAFVVTYLTGWGIFLIVVFGTITFIFGVSALVTWLEEDN